MWSSRLFAACKKYDTIRITENGKDSMIHALVIIIIAVTLIGVYVYRDAKRRGMNALLWVVISVVSVPVGLIIYLFVRRKYNREWSIVPVI